MTKPTLTAEDHLRSVNMMRQLLHNPMNDQMCASLKEARRQEEELDAPNEELIEFLGLIIRGGDENKKRASRIITMYEERIRLAQAAAAVNGVQPAAPAPAPTPSPVELAKIAVPGVTVDNPLLAKLVPDAQPTALGRSLTEVASLVTGTVADTTPPPYRPYAGGQHEKLTIQRQVSGDAATGADPTFGEHLEYAIVAPGQSTDLPIRGVSGLVLSVAGNTKLDEHGLAYVLPLPSVVPFNSDDAAIIRVALKLPESIVHFDAGHAPGARHAPAFMELYHLMQAGYIFLLEVHIQRIQGEHNPHQGHRFHLQLNTDRILIDRQAIVDGKVEIKSGAFLHLSDFVALHNAASKLVVAGILGAV